MSTACLPPCLNPSSFVWSLSIYVFPHVSYDIILYSGNICSVKPPHHRLSLRINQKFLKVPLNVMDLHRCPEESCRVTKSFHNWWTGVLQEGVNFLFIFPIYINFLKELEIGDKTSPWPDMFYSLKDFRILSRFLFSKLIAWEA